MGAAKDCKVYKRKIHALHLLPGWRSYAFSHGLGLSLSRRLGGTPVHLALDWALPSPHLLACSRTHEPRDGPRGTKLGAAKYEGMNRKYVANPEMAQGAQKWEQPKIKYMYIYTDP